MGTGEARSGAIPEAIKADAKAAHEALVELVAEGKDELMEEFFNEGTIPEEHLIGALHEAIREDRIFPVLYVSGLRNVGTDHLLDFLKVYAPAPTEREPVAAHGILQSMRSTVPTVAEPWMFRTRSSCARWGMRSRSRSMSTRR